MEPELVLRKTKFKNSVDALFLTREKEPPIEFYFIQKMCMSHKL